MASEDGSDEIPESLTRNALAVVVTLLARFMPEGAVPQAVPLSQNEMGQLGTPLVQATPEVDSKPVEPILEKKPKRNFKSPRAGSSQEEFLEWLLTGVSEEDGDADHYEDTDWFIKRILSEDEAMSVRVLTQLANDAGIDISKSTMNRLISPLKKGEYNSYIMQRCQDLNISIANVFPGKNPKAKFTGNAWHITEE